jgi:hypothetical protein
MFLVLCNCVIIIWFLLRHPKASKGLSIAAGNFPRVMNTCENKPYGTICEAGSIKKLTEDPAVVWVEFSTLS